MHLLVLGLGYCAAHFATAAAARGARVTAVRSRAAPGVLTLDSPELPAAIATATHILSSVPPAADGSDPVLAAHRERLAAAPARWVGYLSSTGVYGDTGGAWVDEAAPLQGRRAGRLAADLEWQALHPAARVFRLPGIYGPGRSALDRLCAGPVARIDLPGHVFSRVHVDDITGALLASPSAAPPGSTISATMNPHRAKPSPPMLPACSARCRRRCNRSTRRNCRRWAAPFMASVAASPMAR